ncbi:MAG: Gfo/Idh/MocA family oxidoreductase [Chthonomonas sp.]|nr:Gfo/Idh/MocA family oxidoreductase [Chthonomonas sp.]
MLATEGVFAGEVRSAAKIKVGLIGCGGRGSGAARDCMAADKDFELYAVGDLFEDRLNQGMGWMGDIPAAQMNVGNRKFTGFDAYKQVIDSGVDVIILTTPPGFRPRHFSAAIEAGKHVFMEKPVAVDPTGIRMVMAAAEMAKKKNLTVVAGTQRRHDVAYNQCISRIKKGEIGEVVAMNCYWNQGGLWKVDRAANMSDTEWMIRNWLYFTMLSGDHIAEQHIHNIDVCNWVMGEHPVSAMSLAGRQVRTGGDYGHVFDHFATEFVYANGVKMISMCRQIDGCDGRVSEHIVGSKGISNANTSIKAGKKAWRFEGDRPNPYVLEHVRLAKSIKADEGFNEGKQVAESTLTAIMGRMAGYSGKLITWDDAMKSDLKLMPDDMGFGSMPMPAVAIPGR